MLIDYFNTEEAFVKVKGKQIDFLLWISITVVSLSYLFSAFDLALSPMASNFTYTVYEFVNTVWIGLVLGVFFMGILGTVPREIIVCALGNRGGLQGIFRATFAGILLDLCSHGILMVGMKFYERGVSIGQVVAFLVASPWNSLSLTIILWTLIGFWWTLIFIAGSFLIAVSTGLLFELCVKQEILPENPHKVGLPQGFEFWKEVKKWYKGFSFSDMPKILWQGLLESRMLLRWLLFGIVLAGIIRTAFSPDQFQILFGPTLAGLGLTLVAATILEVCSEGSVPIAAEIFVKAKAPGNAFAFLMAGVSTDYTEIMLLKETTKGWRIPLFLPLLTLPQILLLALILNMAV